MWKVEDIPVAYAPHPLSAERKRQTGIQASQQETLTGLPPFEPGLAFSGQHAHGAGFDAFTGNHDIFDMALLLAAVGS